MTRSRTRILWGLVLLLVLFTSWRAATLPNPYRPGAPLGRIDDRREHRFRDLTYRQTQQLVERLVQMASSTADVRTRARLLAKLAALQHERGLAESADAAAREALRLSGSDPEVRRLLATPLVLEAPTPSPWP